MNPATETKKTDEMSLTEIAVGLLRYYLGGRRGLILLTVAVLGAGLFFNWGWLVAAGIAPLLLAIAPCAAMCALGLCMNRIGNKSGPTQSGSSNQDGGGTPPSSTDATKTRDDA